jgi:hypothetical protein
MTREQAKEILGSWVNPNGSLKCRKIGAEVAYVGWSPFDKTDEVCLEGHFTLTQLEAILAWVKTE